jgi:hypothetical protein
MNDDAPVTERMCRERVAHVGAQNSEIIRQLALLNDRLFKDNGHLSVQTRLDRHERILSAQTWLMTIFVGAVVVSGVGLVASRVYGILTGTAAP